MYFKYILSGHEVDFVTFVHIQQLFLMCWIWQSMLFVSVMKIYLHEFVTKKQHCSHRLNQQQFSVSSTYCDQFTW
jgi:hypothetical protein